MKMYFLDPDYRKDPDISKPYCCRCQKLIKGKAIRVTEIYDGAPFVYEDEKGSSLVGPDCWRLITKDGHE